MTGNGWHHDQRRAMIQTECNGWSAYAANIFNASRQSSGSRAVDDHATDTMTGTAHMLSDCVPSMTTPRRPWNVQRRMFHVLRLTYWSACAACPEFVPMTGSAGTMTHTRKPCASISCATAMQTHTRCKGTESVTDTMPGTRASIGVQRGEDDTHATAQSSGHIRKPMTKHTRHDPNGAACPECVQ